jgi:hypothetical protein
MMLQHKTTPLRAIVFLGACLGAGVLAAPAGATIAFSPTNSPTGGEQNIMFEAPDLVPHTTQTGDTNQTNSPVIFDTTFTAGPGSMGMNGSGQNIAADGIGQGNIVCEAGGTPCVDNSSSLNSSASTQLNSLEMKPGPGFAWTDVVANPDFGIGTMNVFVQDNMGNNFDFVLTKGSNFFTLTATGGEVITDVQMSQEVGTSGPFGWNDFKQPRVSGVCTLVGATCTALPVPEPRSIAILVTALAGLGWLGWRRRSAA